MMKSRYKFSLALSLLMVLAGTLPGLSVSSSTKSQPQAQFTNSQNTIVASRWQRSRAPSWGLFGARRGSCLTEQKELIPLVPPDLNLDPYGRFTYHKSVWNSATPYPTIFFYLPQDNLTKGQLILENELGKPVYSVLLEFPAQAGVISVKLPEFSPRGNAFPPLEIGKDYRWIISIECQDDVNPEIGGGIHRIDPQTVASDGESVGGSMTLEQALKQASSSDLPNVYERANIWYNTLSSLAELMEAQPDNPELKQRWHDLMVEVGYDSIADAPLVGSATVLQEEVMEEN